MTPLPSIATSRESRATHFTWSLSLKECAHPCPLMGAPPALRPRAGRYTRSTSSWEPIPHRGEGCVTVTTSSWKTPTVQFFPRICTGESYPCSVSLDLFLALTDLMWRSVRVFPFNLGSKAV